MNEMNDNNIYENNNDSSANNRVEPNPHFSIPSPLDDEPEGGNQYGVNAETLPMSDNVSTYYNAGPTVNPINVVPSETASSYTIEPEISEEIPKSHSYTEHIRAKKKHRFRPIAAILVITVLNLAVVGGAFVLGMHSGSLFANSPFSLAANKQNLINTMRNPNSSGIVTTANTDNATAAPATVQGELATTEIAKKVGPAVVGITSIVQGQMGIFGTTSQSQSEGSGIILSEDGYIVTNNHVVAGATNVKVLLNTGTEYDATLIGADEETDLAVIKIEPTETLTVATLGDSSILEVGERVVAIGNPMGLEFFGSVTEGIVSAVNRSISVDNRTMNLIQTDAAINSGNSGGALINSRGEVIGINSVKVAYSGVEGMGFAIPITEARQIVADLLEYGYVKGRPVIGISTRDVSSYMAQMYSWPQGVQVMEISSEAAKNAGLQQGDIITEVDGQAISTTDELNRIKSTHSPGDALKMTVYKYATGTTESVEVILSEQLPG